MSFEEAMKPPFEKLKIRHRELLRRIPHVKFYGMGEDGFYSVHIVEECLENTSIFIKQEISEYRLHFVPWMKDESIKLLGCAGGPLHSRPRDIGDEGLLDDFVANPMGTIGGLAALVDKYGPSSQKE
ncbi:unnamed protein product, partial [Owenia fusiformis]